MSQLVLGISAYFHDSAAAIVSDGVIVAAAQEERFSRRRHDSRFPSAAVRYCLDEAGSELSDLTAVGYYENSQLKMKRLAVTFAAIAPMGYSRFRETMPGWMSRKRNAPREVAAELASLGRGRPPEVVSFLHHESHAASAFIPSPYRSAAILCIDGVGEWTTTSLWHGVGNQIEPIKELRFPHSLGMLYSAFTYFCGFTVDSGEYKLMGLAPYGEPRYEGIIREKLIDLRPDGSFRLNMRYFEYLRGQRMVGKAFENLFGGPRREPESELTPREFDLAASIQAVTDDVILRLAKTARRETGESCICMAGGVALNCTANGGLVRSRIFDEVWVQPAAGDAGGALGAAYLASSDSVLTRDHLAVGTDAMAGALLGPHFSNDDVESFLESRHLPYSRHSLDKLTGRVAQELANGKIVAWFRGRMEFGPRALGARSILADPRDAKMQSALNLKIKFRESFRPFAPAVLSEDVREYFDLDQASPYMLIIAKIAETQRVHADNGDNGKTGLAKLQVVRSRVPAVTHVDSSARIQTVDRGDNSGLHGLLSEFKRVSGCSALVNTSLNVRGEPIVHNPAEAYACFMRTGIDLLVLEDFLLEKTEQPKWSEDGDWREDIPLD